MEKIEVCNIWKCECYVTLRNDEVLCHECKGSSGFFTNAAFKSRKFTVRRCPMCLGFGKIDWIQAINKQRPLTSGSKHPFAQLSRDIKMRCIGPKHCKKHLKRLWLETKKLSDFDFEYHALGKTF
jgi:hypothetical protein